MKNAFWLIVGILTGFVAAHLVANDARGKKFFDDVDSKAKQFTAAIVDGYKDREAELRSTVEGIVADADEAIADATKRSE